MYDMKPIHICKSDEKFYVFKETLDDRRYDYDCIKYAPHLFLKCASSETLICNCCAKALSTDVYKLFTINDLENVETCERAQHYSCKVCRIGALSSHNTIETTESVRASLFLNKKLCLQIIDKRCCYKEANFFDSEKNPLCSLHTKGKANITKIKAHICRTRKKRFDLCKFHDGCAKHASFGVLSFPFVEAFCKRHKQPGMFNLRRERTNIKSIDITEYFTNKLNKIKMPGVDRYSIYQAIGDGNCFFNCVSKALFDTESNCGPKFLREKLHSCARRVNNLQLVSSQESSIYDPEGLSNLVTNRLLYLSRDNNYFDITLVPTFCKIFMFNVLLVTESGLCSQVAPYQSFVVDIAWPCLILLFSSIDEHFNILFEEKWNGEKHFIFNLSASNRLFVQLQSFFQIATPANTQIIGDNGGIQSREEFYAALQLELLEYSGIANGRAKRKKTTATDNNSEPQNKNNKKFKQVNPAVVNAELVRPFSPEEMNALMVSASQKLQGVVVTNKLNERQRNSEIKSLKNIIEQHVNSITQGELLQSIIKNVEAVEELLGGRERAVLFFNLYKEKTLKTTNKILIDIGSSNFISLQLSAELFAAVTAE
jgi:hypothetical protein